MGLTLKQLAGDRVTPSQISAIEKGKCKPSFELLKYIAQRLDVDVEYFTLSEGERYRKEFEEIRAKSKELFEEGQYDLAKSTILVAYSMVNFLSDNQKGYFYYLQGDCCYKENNYSGAFDYYIKALTCYLKTKDNNKIIDTYLKVGNCLYNSDKYDMALAYY